MSTQLQILESNPSEDDGGLQYVATEEAWRGLLDTAGLTDGSPRRLTQAEEEKAETDGLSNGVVTNHGNYSVISIMGPQSSGKSTILNKLFGCKFEVMDHTRGRHQVTRGIWMGMCKKATDLLIMDLEGTDAIERKKNRGNFERQTSLMALTLSEVLIINMWASDIGRAAGMNVDTLKSIIQANLRLFAPNTKTRLLFLIREQNPDESAYGVTPASILEQTTRRVINQVWMELDKPDTFRDKDITDLFDISFFFMPPLVYFADLFAQRVQELHSRFTNPNDPNYYFNTPYHYKKSVPCEGLYTWTRQIWESVSKDESLNIPDQQKLLATYRCEHALTEAFSLFTNNSLPLMTRVANGYVNKFGEEMDIIIKEALFNYNQTANKYDRETAQMKYDELVEKIEMKVQGIFLKQLDHITNEMIGLFNSKLDRLTRNAKSSGECVDNLDMLVRDTAEEIRKQFSSMLDDSMITSNNQELTNKELYWTKMMERLRESTKKNQFEQWGLLMKENEKLADEKLMYTITQMLKTPDERVWEKISALRIDYHGNALNGRVIKKLQNLMYPETEVEEKIDRLREIADEQIKGKIKESVESYDQVMRERFDKIFNYETTAGNTTGGNIEVPRDWNNPALDVRELFMNAKQQCLEMLEICRDITLEGNSDLNLSQISLKLLNSQRLQQIEERFNQYADREYRNAEDRIRRIQMGVSGILPNSPVAWAIFLFFAWNEIWDMLRNPLYLILVVLLGMIAFIVYQANTMGYDVKTVALQLLQMVMNSVMRQVQNFQNSHAQVINNHKTRSGSNLNDIQSRFSNEPTEMGR